MYFLAPYRILSLKPAKNFASSPPWSASLFLIIRSRSMNETQQTILNELQFYFVVRQDLPDGSYRLSLSSYAPFRDDRVTFPFDSESDAALYLLGEFRKGAPVSYQDVETARAIMRGEKTLFLYEEKQPDGTLLLSLHDHLPPAESKVVTFASRSAKLMARFLLERLYESERVHASDATIRRAWALMD
jgi:hypothetical protein